MTLRETSKWDVIEVQGTDQYGQLQVAQVETQEHINAVRAEFIERCRDERGLLLSNVKARKVDERFHED